MSIVTGQGASQDRLTCVEKDAADAQLQRAARSRSRRCLRLLRFNAPMVQRVQVELNDISSLSTRIRQQSVFNAMKPSATPPQQKPAGGGGEGSGLDPAAPDKSDRAGALAGEGAREGKAQAGWDKERERAAQTRNDAAYQAQACNNLVRES